MKTSAILGGMALALSLLTAGCGGGGGGDTTPSPYAGQWRGNWNSPGTNDSGTTTITVATSGAMTGTMHNVRTGNDGAISGSSNAVGTVNGTAQYPGLQPISLSGTITINGGGHLVGNLTQRINNQNYPLSFDLTRQ